MNATSNQTVKIGDIYYCSWGYEQTNIDYYMVVKVTKNSAWLASLPDNRTYTGPMCGKCSPVVKHPNELGTGKMHRIKRFDSGEPYFRINSYSTAFACQPDSSHFFSEWY